MAANASLNYGVDVARFGDDDSVVVRCRGYEASIDFRVNGFDGNQVADAIVLSIGEHRKGNEIVCVRVDVIGYGASVVDALEYRRKLKQLDDRVHIFGINVTVNADDPEKYHSFGDQI